MSFMSADSVRATLVPGATSHAAPVTASVDEIVTTARASGRLIGREVTQLHRELLETFRLWPSMLLPELLAIVAQYAVTVDRSPVLFYKALAAPMMVNSSERHEIIHNTAIVGPTLDSIDLGRSTLYWYHGREQSRATKAWISAHVDATFQLFFPNVRKFTPPCGGRIVPHFAQHTVGGQGAKEGLGLLCPSNPAIQVDETFETAMNLQESVSPESPAYEVEFECNSHRRSVGGRPSDLKIEVIEEPFVAETLFCTAIQPVQSTSVPTIDRMDTAG